VRKIDGDAARGFRDLCDFAINRGFLMTKSGRYGLSPRLLQDGDLCCVLFGAKVPFVIRPTGDESQCKLVGECYVEGIMRGEIVKL
jgi:hypothetical protein